MKREEAIKILREAHDNALFSVRTALETLIPELVDSKDEIIRKELLALVRMNVLPEATCLVRGGSVTRAQAEAYLEKQKEQKPCWNPTEEDVALFNKAITTNTSLSPQERAKLDILRMKFKHRPVIEQKEQKEIPLMGGDTDTYFDDLRITTKPLTSREWFDEGIKYVQRLHKEQKPAEYLDKDKIYAIMKKLHNLSFSQGILINSKEYKQIDEITHDVRDLLDYPIEQKPEWSAKGRRGRIGTTPKHIRKKAENFLSKMEPPYDADDICSAYETGAMENANPSWSEEDESIRQRLTNFISSPNIEAFLLVGDEQMFVSWLKSLRPMPKAAVIDGTIWRPSVKQMMAMKNIAYGMYQNGDGPILRELYEQLKELM